MNSVEQPTNWMATASLVLGVLGLLGALTLASAGAVLGGGAIVVGVVARRLDTQLGRATTGMVLGAIAVVVGVVSTVLTASGAWR